MHNADLSHVRLLPFESALEGALRALVMAAAGMTALRATSAWRLASAIATERDPSDTLMREALACLCAELEAHGKAGRLDAYQAAQRFIERHRAAA